ncbi:MAG TPA: NAD-dependent epimerase/dehydratase family protein [Candidatus Bathyarchaeia archaeon]|nr:NAD-dependent epimerase/dehydratase family protein [Candidatus Bathyarchaeia archaeon]
MKITGIHDIATLDRKLSEPPAPLVETMRRLDGDLLILGAGGKMGPSLSEMAMRAIEASRRPRNVTAVSTFSTPGLRARLESAGVRTIQCNLLDPGAVDALPDAENVIFMAGRKFGSTGAEWLTWAENVLLPGLVGRRYCNSRIVSFSTGSIYPLEPVDGGGSTEHTPPEPVGDYAMSCVGRERMFDYCARELGARVLHLRLNYAVELRYGVLVDVASRVWAGLSVDLTMGYFNCVWQAYANAVALMGLELASSPPEILNVTGPETVSVRALAEKFGERMDKTPIFTGHEAPTALLSNASKCHQLFGPPGVSLEMLIDWTTDWTMAGREIWSKPTHYETRDGKF